MLTRLGARRSWLVPFALAVATIAPLSAAASNECMGREVTILGTNGPDDIEGTAGRDVIDARAGRDKVRGLGGNDLICLGPGGGYAFFDDITARFEQASGGGGDDVISGGSGLDIVEGDQGNDKLSTGPSPDVVGGFGQDQLNGGPGNDVLEGGPDADELVGAAGHDKARGGGGLDFFVGGPGDDLYDGGPGRNEIFFRYKHDRRRLLVDLTRHIIRGQGRDSIFDVDVVQSLVASRIIGNAAPNDIFVDDGDDIVYGRGGDDVLTDVFGRSLLHGGSGDDRFEPNAALDRARVVGGSGSDMLDLYRTECGGDNVVVHLNESFWRCRGRRHSVDGVENVKGTFANDVIFGNGAANLLLGKTGDDRIRGGKSADIVRSGRGGDTLFGDSGGDDLDGGPGTDPIDGGPGSDSCANGEPQTNCEN